jgi:hypothetical protein
MLTNEIGMFAEIQESRSGSRIFEGARENNSDSRWRCSRLPPKHPPVDRIIAPFEKWFSKSRRRFAAITALTGTTKISNARASVHHESGANANVE